MHQKQIHINLNRHRHNKKTREYPSLKLPAITVRTYKGIEYFDSVKIDGEIEFIYRPNKPLSCGAKMWISTNGNVTSNKTSEGFTRWYDEDYLDTRIDMYYKPGIEYPMRVTLNNPDDLRECEAT